MTDMGRAAVIRSRNTAAVRASRLRNGYRAEKIRARAIVLAAKWVRENAPDIWIGCMREARAYVDAAHRAERRKKL